VLRRERHYRLDRVIAAQGQSFLGLAAVACVACCVGPILAVLGAVAAVGVVSICLIGVGGLLIAAAASAAFMVVRRRRIYTSCSVGTQSRGCGAHPACPVNGQLPTASSVLFPVHRSGHDHPA
jgi:hypothetical protein